MLGAVKSAPISIAFQAAVTHLEVAMPFIRFRPFKPLSNGRDSCWKGALTRYKPWQYIGLGGAGFFVFEDWL